MSRPAISCLRSLLLPDGITHSRLPTRPDRLHCCHRSLAPRKNRREALSAHTSRHRFHAGCVSLCDAKPELAGTSLAPHAGRETEVQGTELRKTSCSPASRGSCP